MAKYNEILAGRYNRFLQKYLTMKGDPPASQLAGEIQPQFDVVKVPVDLRFLLGETLWGQGLNIAGSAGNLSALRIRNPVGSNCIIVIEKISATPSVSEPVLVNRGPTAGADLNAPVSGALRDARIGQPSGRGSVALISVGNPAATQGATIVNVNIVTNVTQDIILHQDQELVLAPGDQYTVYGITVNTGLSVTVFWRERTMEDGELTG
jgi:hypothetical protein